jgi:hypothetical protein
VKKLEEQFYVGLRGEEKVPVSPPEASSIPAPAPRPISQKSLFSHPDTHPLVLDLALLKHFQVEWFQWLPETLFSEIEKTFGTNIAEVNKLKIMAVKTLHVIDAFWDHWEIFEKTVMALNGIPPRLDAMQPPDLPLLFSGVALASSIRVEEFHGEVARYCAAVFLNESVHYAPEPLDFCQVYISQPTYCCKDCDKCGSALPPFDGLCSSCAGHYTTDLPFSFKPDQAALDRGHGRNITMGQIYDEKPTKARFEQLKNMTAGQLGSMIKETPEDIASAKLITAIDFMDFRSQQLKEQLGFLRGWLETT